MLALTLFLLNRRQVYFTRQSLFTVMHFLSKMCLSLCPKQRCCCRDAGVQGLTDVLVPLPAPLVGHEQPARPRKHEGVDGADMVHGSQAS